MSAGFAVAEAVRPAGYGTTGRRVRTPVAFASGGDHAAIYYFLSPIFQGSSSAEFKAATEDPFCTPQDRLLIRRDRGIVAHAQITHRAMHFGPLQIPAAGLGWLAVAPECRGERLGTHLLAVAQRQMLDSGALIGLLRTRIPHFFRRHGWALCGRPHYSHADVRTVLATLSEAGMCQRRQRHWHIRPWRRWELGALVRIYRQSFDNAYGSLERTEAYWHWLIRRQAYDQLYVALEGPELFDLTERSTRIIGYAAVHGEQIVEMATAPDRPRAAFEMIARACGDAIEHDRHVLLVHAPPQSPIHDVFQKAGGVRSCQESDGGRVYMARLLDPLKLLRRLCGEFERRREAADLPQPLELGLLVDDKKYQIELAREGARAVSRRIGRHYLQLNVADFTRMVLGQLDWDVAVAEGRLAASTTLAAQAGRALFPSLPFWRPPLDDLEA